MLNFNHWMTCNLIISWNVSMNIGTDCHQWIWLQLRFKWCFINLLVWRSSFSTHVNGLIKTIKDELFRCDFANRDDGLNKIYTIYSDTIHNNTHTHRDMYAALLLHCIYFNLIWMFLKSKHSWNLILNQKT